MTVKFCIADICTEELSVSGNRDDPEKADMRIVQASAQEVCTLQNEYCTL